MNEATRATHRGWSVRNLARAALRRVPFIGRHVLASAGYRIIAPGSAKRENDSGWSSGRTARRQDTAYENLLRQMRGGAPRIDLQVAANAVLATGLQQPSLLEVGCGSGYYQQVFTHLLSSEFDYTGLDYSAAMIEAARQRSPAATFAVGNACELPYGKDRFDIVFNGACLMHVIDYERAIAESARVARRFCIYHSLPLFVDRETTYLAKYAYGSPVVEIVFNRAQLLEAFARHGLQLVNAWPSIDYDVHPVTAEHSICETFLLHKLT